MAKMKISELAETLKNEGHNFESKDIIKALDELNIKNNDKKFVSASSIEDDAIDKVKAHLGVAKKEAPKAAPKAEAPKADEVRAEAPKTEAAPKKKLSVVFNPQNSSQPNRMARPQRPDGQRPARPDGARPARPDGQRPVRPEGARPDGQRPVRPEGARADGARPVRPEGVRTEGARPVRPEGARPDGVRPVRPEGARPVRPEGARPDGNRPARPEGARPDGNRPARPEGARPDGNRPQRSDRPEGNRFDGNRPQRSDRPEGGRFDGNRPQRNDRPDGGNRFDKDGGNRFDKDGGNRGGDRRQDNRGDRGQRGDFNRDKKVDIKLEPALERKPEARSEKRLEKRPEKADRDTLRPEGKLDKLKPVKKPAQKPVQEKKEEDEIKVIVLPEKMTIKELAEKMKMQPSVLVKQLFMKGKMVTINQEIDFETAEEIALEYEIICEKEEIVDVIEELLKEDEEDEATMVARPPVVCVMGHVDHGKTSLLDAIRSTNVISREAGGITQHIGAYMVEINGQKITFLDTPGHEAFTAMRMRGAKSTDIAILVVAADDGVMPQTVEAINHARAAGVEIIVAINKIDKPSANVDRVKQELIEHELVAEDWGGNTVFVPVSAHTREGIENLLEMILLTAELKELKANPKRKARGLVIEAQLDKGKGAVATVLVQKGTLRVGDLIAVGPCHGKIRAMIDDKGRRVKEAGPSTPVEILGLNDVPNAGDIFVITDTEKEARSFAETFITQGKEKLIEETKAKLSLDGLFSQIQAGNVKELNIIVKADVQGSVEAIKQSLMKLSNEEVVVKVIHGGVGAINESDVILASASNAIIIGFNVRPDNIAKATSERENVDIRLYRVIYQAIEDVEAAMKGMLEPIYVEKVIGHAEVRATFKASGIGVIAGSYVLDGKLTRGCKARVTREGELIFDGLIASMKHLKDDVKEVRTGFECGLVFEKFNDLKEGDQIEAYIMEEVPR